MRSTRLAAALLVTLTACAGQVRTTIVSADEIKPGRSFQGVIVYQPTLVKLTYAFTTRVDKDGNVIGSAAEQTCRVTVQKEELSVIADPDRPSVISNASGAFSAAKFSATIANGMLTGVNAEPTQKPSDLITATSALVKEFGLMGTGGGRDAACNAAPVLTAIRRVTIPAM